MDATDARRDASAPSSSVRVAIGRCAIHTSSPANANTCSTSSASLAACRAASPERRAGPPTARDQYVQELAAGGLWNNDVGPHPPFRVINQQSRCVGPALIMFKQVPPQSEDWTPLPERSVAEGDCVWMRVAYGTLVSLARLRSNEVVVGADADAPLLPAAPPPSVGSDPPASDGRVDDDDIGLEELDYPALFASAMGDEEFGQQLLEELDVLNAVRRVEELLHHRHQLASAMQHHHRPRVEAPTTTEVTAAADPPCRWCVACRFRWRSPSALRAPRPASGSSSEASSPSSSAGRRRVSPDEGPLRSAVLAAAVAARHLLHPAGRRSAAAPRTRRGRRDTLRNGVRAH